MIPKYRAVPPAVRPTPVPYDPALEPSLAFFLDVVEKVPLRADTIAENREQFTSIVSPIEQQIEGRTVTFEHTSIPGAAGAPAVEITIIRPNESKIRLENQTVTAHTCANADTSTEPSTALRPGVLGIHGGGYVLGNRFFGTDELIDLAERYGAVGIAVEYRLAPEHPAPAASEDCYAALVWFATHAAELGVDPERLVVSGASAGGGLAAAVALMSRDRSGPKLAGQLLNCPMLDDRNDTVSSWQYDGIGAWDRNNNDCGWDAYVGEDRGSDRVHPYQAPARAASLAGLAPALLEVGSAEVFRDETVEYASRIWAAGGQAELHVWSGGYHAFSGFATGTIISQAAISARDSWWRRVLGL